ncbi:MAG TPA: hypothetical protein VFQ43_21470, partial [Nitrososphaera sp.]|nr:hypothetical protein [Nitrososphaera sp.]
MLIKILSYLTVPVLLCSSSSSGNCSAQSTEESIGGAETLERMIVATAQVSMDLNLDQLKGIPLERQEFKLDRFGFEVSPDSFFTIRVLNRVLRGPEPGAMRLIWRNSRILPEPLNASSNQLVVERIRSGEPFDLVI